MPVKIKDLKIPIAEAKDEAALERFIAETILGRQPESRELRIDVLKRSLDARKKNKIHYVYQVLVSSQHDDALLRAAVAKDLDAEVSQALPRQHPLDGLAQQVSGLRDQCRHRPVIIGTGPAGIFAALVLAEAGLPPLIVERGQPVERRMRDVNALRREGRLDPESNYCFGEGGAGTFSDGKLTCGRNHPLIRYLFERWVDFGAPKDILWEAHPHIGTDYLMRVALNMRRHLESLGCEFRFGTRLEDLETGTQKSRYKLRLSNGDLIESDHVVLAIGHSARDTYAMLLERGMLMVPKPFAIGARIEHPQSAIDRIQYGSCELLPAAEYKLTAQAQGRGIWTFCMCPGGTLIPTSAQPGHLAINGMSYHARASGYANAAVVVNVQREDFFKGHVLDGVRFQQELEQAAFRAGGGGYASPGQRLTDFLKGRPTRGELDSTYKPAVVGARLDQLLPDFIVGALRAALVEYDKRMRGYLSSDAIIAGVESKTSAPVVITRDRGLQSVSHPGIFPTGEGAGFAGGIVSAALDGVKVGRALIESCTEAPVARLLH